MASGSMRVTVNIRLLSASLRSLGKRYVTVREVSRLLGVSTRTAGKLMARLEGEGVVRRYSFRAYEVLAPLERRSSSLRE